MIRFALLCLTICLWAGAALAQEIRVRSGEHGSFTRLALDVPVDTAWNVVQMAPNRVELRLGEGGFRFDGSTVFNRIDRERIAGLEPLPDGAGLGIELACACVAEAFLAEPAMLVIDIRPGEFVASEAAVEPAPRVDDAPLSEIRVGALPGIGPSPERNPLLPGFVPQARRAEPESAPREPGAGMDPTLLEQTLAEQLAIAATDGLLSPGLTPAPSAPPSAMSSTPAEDEEPGEGVPDLSGHRGAIEAAILGRSPSDMQARVRVGGTGCVPDAALDLTSWGSDETFDSEIPVLRRRLYGEFDALDPEILLELVRAHIYIGFGAEARALLELDQERRDPVLFALAGIVDGGADRAGVFAGQTDCKGAASLWALAGAPSLPEGAMIDDKAVRRAFEALPETLRELLGPTLATRLAEAGHRDAARNLLSRLARSGGAPDEEMRYSEAQIDRLDGAVDEAMNALMDLSHGAGRHAPDAVVATIALAAEQGAGINKRLTDLTGAYSTELRATEQGPDLWLAHLRALTANRLFDQAVATLRDGADFPEQQRRLAASELMSALAAQGSDTGFLRQAVTRKRDYDRLVSEDTALAVARRLLALGLPDEALSWATLPVIARDLRARRLLESEIHLVRADPQQAEIALIGLQGDDALELRARARAMMGDYTYAQMAFGSLGETGEARMAAWLAGDWDAVDGEEDALAAAAALVDSGLPAESGAVPSLALAEALATSGAETRDTLRALLDQTRMAEE